MSSRSLLISSALLLQVVALASCNTPDHSAPTAAVGVEVASGTNGLADASAPAPASRPRSLNLAQSPSAPRANAAPSSQSAEPPATPGQTPIAIPGDMLIRSGTATIEVDSLEIGIARVEELARATRATIANTSLESGMSRVRSATLQLRIPSARFDEVRDGLAPIGKVESVDIQAEDVGEEFVDISARVANARRLEERLINLLERRTGKLEEVLRVESELARVREEIERYQGRIRYLQSRIATSTLTIVLHEPRPLVGSAPGQNPIARAFVTAWKNLVSVTATIIASLGVLIPLGAIVGLVFYLVRRYLARRVPDPRPPAT